MHNHIQTVSTSTLSSSRKTALREQHTHRGRDRETGAAAGAEGGNWSPGSSVTTVGPTTFDECFRWRWGHQVGRHATVVHGRFVLSRTESDSNFRVWSSCSLERKWLNSVFPYPSFERSVGSGTCAVVPQQDWGRSWSWFELEKSSK